MKKQYTDPELEIIEFAIEKLMTSVSDMGEIPDTDIGLNVQNDLSYFGIDPNNQGPDLSNY